MNPLVREAAGSVQLGWVMGVMTAVFLVFFIGWTLWAYSPARRKQLDEAAMMPLRDGGEG